VLAHLQLPLKRPCRSAMSAACCMGGLASLPLPALSKRPSAKCIGVHISSGPNQARGCCTAGASHNRAGTSTCVCLCLTPKHSATRRSYANHNGWAGPASSFDLQRQSAAAERLFSGRLGTAYRYFGGGRT
jgi:hypothetical protein